MLSDFVQLIIKENHKRYLINPSHLWLCPPTAYQPPPSNALHHNKQATVSRRMIGGWEPGGFNSSTL